MRISATVAGNRLELFPGGRERLRLLLQLIHGAESSIRMLFYMYNDDRIGRLIRSALLDAAHRGVSVDILIDQFGSKLPGDFFEELAALPNSRVCIFHPSIGRRYLLRNHQKMVVVDERIVIIGGANIDKSYLSDVRDDRWRDLWLTVEGPEVAPAVDYFDALFRWTKRKRPQIRSLRRITAQKSEWRGAVQWKFSGPLSRRDSWLRAIARDMADATSLDMIFAYFAPPSGMLARIGAVAARGSARVVTAAKSDNSATIAAARSTYARLLRRNVEIYEYQPAKLHTKLAVVDDVTYIGASNFDYRSLYINLELMLRIEDAGFAEQMRGYVAGEIADSVEVTMEAHRRRATAWRRAKWRLSHFLVNVMDYTVTRRLNFASES